MISNILSSKIHKFTLVIVGFLVGILVVVILIASMIFSWKYVYRLLAWGESDVNDDRYNFPLRQLTAAVEPSPFD